MAVDKDKSKKSDEPAGDDENEAARAELRKIVREEVDASIDTKIGAALEDFFGKIEDAAGGKPDAGGAPAPKKSSEPPADEGGGDGGAKPKLSLIDRLVGS